MTIVLLMLLASSNLAAARVAGQVVDRTGAPLAGVVVFAADAATDAIVALATSDGAGRVALALPDRRHNLGVLSPRWGVGRLDRAAGGFTLVLHPLPDDPRGTAPGRLLAGPATEAPGVAEVRAGRAVVIRGRVTDEGGRGLPGVRVEGRRPTGAVVAVAISGLDGRFALALPGGESRLTAFAPGLELARSVSDPEPVDPATGRRKPIVLVMGVAAAVQTISVTEGHVLRFRPQDSIDPEYQPPAPVRAWLQYAYGICPQSAPLTRAQKQALNKYWYLDVLRREPPNPASISTASCSPPSLYDQPSLRVTAGFGSLVGFEPPAQE